MNSALSIIKDHKMFWDIMGRMGRWRLWILIMIISGRIWLICLSRMSTFSSTRLGGDADGIGVITRLLMCIGSSRRRTTMRTSSSDWAHLLAKLFTNYHECNDKIPSVSIHGHIPANFRYRITTPNTSSNIIFRSHACIV